MRPLNQPFRVCRAQTHTDISNELIFSVSSWGSEGAKGCWLPKPHSASCASLLFLFVKYVMEYFCLSHIGNKALTIQAEPLENQSFVSHFCNSFIMFRTFWELNTTNVINEDTEAMAWVMLGLCACCNFGKTRNMWERGFFAFFLNPHHLVLRPVT